PAKVGLLSTNGGLKRVSRVLDWTIPLKATPKPPRKTSRLPNSCLASSLGLQAKPSCGPKFVFWGVNWLPPVRTLMLLKRLPPLPNTTVASRAFFSEIAPKYSQRRPAVTVRLDFNL